MVSKEQYLQQFMSQAKEGQPCKDCGTKLVKVDTRHRPKPGQKYGFKWHLRCPCCNRIFMVEEAKYQVTPEKTLFV